MLSTATPQKPRKARGPGRLKPKHYDYLRFRQSGKTQKEAAKLANIPVETAQRAEKHPEGVKFLQTIADNARIAAQYGLEDAVREVDKAIAFNYQIQNGNAIAKLLEHKSKLFGLLVEKVDIKTTYIDLKGALEQAKERVLKQINGQDRGISVPQTPSLLPDIILPSTNSPTASDPAPIPTDPMPSVLSEIPQQVVASVPISPPEYDAGHVSDAGVSGNANDLPVSDNPEQLT